MKLRVLVPTLAALLSLGACGDKKKDDKASTPAKVTDKAKQLVSDNSPTPSATAPAPDTAQTNAIWALAPADTKLGIVVAPGSAAELQSMLMTVMATAEARPAGAKLVAEIRAEAKDGPFDPLDPASIKAAGLDLEGGIGVFMVAEKHGYLMLPVSDREAFRKLTEGSVETIDGMEVDKIEDDMFCTSKNDLYLCASEAKNLKDFGDTVDGPLAKRVAALPMEYRGQAEFVLDVPAMKEVDDDFDTDFDGQLTDPQLGIGSLRFGNGAATLRGWFQIKALDKVASAAAVPNTLTAGLASSKPSGLFSFRTPMMAFTEELPPSGQSVAGLDLRDDVIGNLTGEFVGYTPQSKGLWGRLAIGVREAGPFKTLLNMGCGMAPAAGIPGIEVIPADGKCSALIDVHKLPLPDPSVAKMFEKPVSIVVESKADRVEITFGDETPTTSNPISATGQEMIDAKWNFSLWTEGMGFATGPAIPWNDMPADVPGEFVDGIKMAVWMLSHVYEIGMAGGIREDGIHGVLHIATYAADAPETFKAYQQAVSTSLGSGDAADQFAAIREKWPNSMAARGGTGAGSTMMASVAGVLAAVAIPAFMKYQQKSMEAAEMYEADKKAVKGK